MTLSTFLGYKIYANNIAQSLSRVAAEPQNASAQKYYEANIGKVTSVDDFLNNYRLFTYAMNAYGLSDLGNAKALMKKVLESDLSDSTSFANKMTDSRYKAFAKAFNFSTSGTIASTAPVQTSAQQQDTLTRMNLDLSVVAGMRASLSAITSVSSLESNSGLYASVLTAYGLNPNTTSKSDVTLALQSNLADPNSFANRTGNETFRTLAEAFNFGADGGIASQHMLQSSQNIAATQTLYMSKIPSDSGSQAAAATESAYYADKLPELTSVDQILSDRRLVAYIKTTFGIDDSISTSQLRSVLTSNLLDSNSLANTLGATSSTPSAAATKYQLLASAFSIGTDGTAWDHGAVMSSANLSAATAAYTAAIGTSDSAATTAGQTETNYFTAAIPSIRSVSGLLSDSRLVAYIKKAFNLPNATTTDLTNILKSDLLNVSSSANTMGGNARKLAAAFNFAPNGLVYAQRPIENATNVAATTSAYQTAAGTGAAARSAAQVETDYFTQALSRVKSVDDLLADKRVVAYLTKAYNLPVTQTSVLRQVLTSDLLDPKSKANTLGSGYLSLAAAFDISSDGSITHAADKAVQSKTGIATTHAAYLEQAMEGEAGDQDGDGVRLALTFKRLAPTITSAYQILGDKALTKVVQTMLGLSANSSKADIDSQARAITSKLNLADFKDPAKLDKLVARFAALYDLSNSSSQSSSLFSV